MGHGNAWDLLQALAQLDRHLVNAEIALLAVHQADVNAGVDFSLRVAGVDGGERVAHLGKRAHQGLDLARPGLGHLQGGAGGGVEVERCFRKVRLGHKFRAQERHHGHAEHKDAQGQQQGF